MKRYIALVLLFALTLCGCSVEFAPELPNHPTGEFPAAEETLSVHFIDVGQADCALIEYADFTMLIDGGNVADSQLVVSYLEQQGIDALTYVVCTHAHEDHVGGLAAVLAVYPTEHVLSPTTTYSSRCFDDFMYYADQQQLEVEIPTPGQTITAGDQLEITILGPIKSYSETNDTSIVLKLEFGETSFLFTGDMETAAETDMLDYWEGRVDWNVDVLKVGHHGSSTSSGYRFLYEAAPEYAIISCGKDNSYGHPHEEVVSRLNDAGIPMFRTDELGTILAVSDGNRITLTWENTQREPADLERAEVSYIGNVNSKKFHSSICSALPKEENRIYFDSYEEAVQSGYSPCGNCLK